MIGGTATGRTIYVAIVTDVTGLLGSDVGAAADAETVKIVRSDSRLVLATSTVQIAREASNRIALEASVGDTLRFYAKSGSNNFDGAVLIEDLSAIKDDDSVSGFALLNVRRTTVTPHDYQSVFPAGFSEQDFWFWQCVVAADGEPHCNVLLAVYHRDEHGRPRFAGRYRWVLRLTVTLTSPPTAQGETTP